MSAPAKRKLAAIVFADIAGYTDRSQKDESGTLDVRGHVERLIKSSALGHNGRIVKTLGDGAMLEFASAVEAVSAALDIQDQMEHLNRELELVEPMQLRIGVHVGDVVEENEDLYGNAVNIASRVHAMAQPGGICITREVYVQIRPILKLQCAPVAGSSTDRLPEKVEVFAILGEEVEGIELAPRKKRSNPMVVAAVSLATLAVVIAGYVMLNPFGEKGGGPSVHRILLPDWVSPGEWFELDAGPNVAHLAVYFGNRPAQSEVVGDRLRVKTPDDIPTAQTTISVFEEGSAKPILNQQTEVIRVGALAMNSGSTNSGGNPLAEGPNVDIDSKPISEKAVSSPSKPNSGSVRPAASPATTTGAGSAASAWPKPGTAGGAVPPAPRSPRLVQIPPMPGMKEYDKMMASIGDPKFKFEQIDLEEMKSMPPTLGRALRTVSIAQTAPPDRAKDQIMKVRLELKGADPKVAAECEAILKTAEAFLDNPQFKGGIHRMGPKWAQAFAFSVNNGTRNLPGLMMIDRLIESKKFEEARRAIAVLLERKDLTESEKKALDRLQAKFKAAEGSGKTEIQSPEAPEPNPGPSLEDEK